MTVANNVPRTSIISTGQTTISSTFPVLNTEQITLYFGDDIAVQGIDYTVDDISGETFDLELTTPQPNGAPLTILRDTPAQRSIDYPPLGYFDADVLDTDIDLVWYKIQELLESFSRLVKLSPSTQYSGDLTLPDPVVGSYLYANPDGSLTWSPPQDANSIVDADTATAGLTRYATDVEVQAHTVTDAAVTPSSLSVAATTPVGTAANNLVQLDANAKLPPIDGSKLTNVSGMGMKNRIINGSMDFAQRGVLFPSVTNAFPSVVDRWCAGVAGASVVSVSQATIGGGTHNKDFESALAVTVTTADASIGATDSGQILQKIEGYNVRDLIGHDFTLSFWVMSPKTGTHCVAFRNVGPGGVPDRSYVMEYTINTVNTWEYKTVTLTGGLITAGTWNFTNGLGLSIAFILAAGSSYQTTANTWQTGNLNATANQVNCLDTFSNLFAVTGVQLEAGSVATPFEHRLFGAELALCQRYYAKSYHLAVAPGTVDSAGAVQFTSAATGLNDRAYVSFKETMRDAPAVGTRSVINATASGNQITDIATNADLAANTVAPGTCGFTAFLGANSVVSHRYAFHWTADAEF